MKKIVFITSHIGSGSLSLSKVMDANPRIQMYQTDTSYMHPDGIDYLVSFYNDGTRREEYMYEDELERPKKSPEVGFL